MGKVKILIVEDEPVAGELMKKILLDEGYDIEMAENGEEALKAYGDNPFDIVISDLRMPIMEGRQLIKELTAMEDTPIIIVETEDNSPETIIEMLQMGVNDYIVKPIKHEEFSFKVHNAVKLAKLEETKRELEKERQSRLEKQQDWNLMKERIAARSYDRFDKTLFSSLKASFNQGAGIGSLISLISHMKNNVKKEEKNYIVREDLMELIFHNAEMAERALNAIADISQMLEEEFNLARVNVQDFFNEIKGLVEDTEPFSKIKNHKVVLGDANYLNVHKQLMLDMEVVKKAFSELLINALKFSVPNSDIYIFTNATSDRFYLSIMNEPDINITGGTKIPEEYEKLIFEPFFRLVKYVYEDYKTLDFGLGLTMVEKIVRKNNGKIYISTVTDKSKLDEKQKNYKINFEVSFPLIQPI